MSTTGTPIVTVYGKPGCGPCTFTKNLLNTAGIEFTYRDVTTDPDALQTVVNLGYQQVPVIIVQEDEHDDWFFEHWSGARPDKIAELATRINNGGVR